MASDVYAYEQRREPGSGQHERQTTREQQRRTADDWQARDRRRDWRLGERHARGEHGKGGALHPWSNLKAKKAVGKNGKGKQARRDPTTGLGRAPSTNGARAWRAEARSTSADDAQSLKGFCNSGQTRLRNAHADSR